MDIVLIGKRIREYREAKKLTQAALAELADISERTLSDIENGKVTPINFSFNVRHMRANARKHIGGYAKISSEGAINIRLKAALSAGRYAMTHMPGTIRKSSGGGFADTEKK